MDEMNQEHLKILTDVINPKATGIFSLAEALAAMQVLQSEIDQLRAENQTLRDLVPESKICQCDDPTIGHDPGWCKRCEKTRV